MWSSDAAYIFLEDHNIFVCDLSVAVPKDMGTFWIYVAETKKPGNVCGMFTFGVAQSCITSDTSEVLPGHRRKGIATAVYRFVQNTLEMEVRPSNLLSPDAGAFWRSLSKTLKTNKDE